MKISPRQILMAAVVLCLSLSVAADVRAQSATTGAIVGTLTTAKGAALPNVTVTVTSPNMVQPRSVVSDREGQFRIMNLPPGRYAVTLKNLPRGKHAADIKLTEGLSGVEWGVVEVSLARTSTVRISERWRTDPEAGQKSALKKNTDKAVTSPVPSLVAFKAAPDKAVPTAAGLDAPPESNFLAGQSFPPAKKETPPKTSTVAPIEAAGTALTNIYRLGPGDVLDVRLASAPTGQSTLYTVTEGGLLDHPLLGEPLRVAGLTPEEAASRLGSEFARRAVVAGTPQVAVSVREYASHTVIISGLVSDPGTKVLRREGVPLYVVIADAQPKSEAGRAVIVSHATNQRRVVDLADAEATNVLVQSGDVISVEARLQEFFYIGGEVTEPGEKPYRAGMTLTQGILAAGGAARSGSNSVEVSRQNAQGMLVVSQYSLKDIKSGKAPDPRLQPGDRVEVSRR